MISLKTRQEVLPGKATRQPRQATMPLPATRQGNKPGKARGITRPGNRKRLVRNLALYYIRKSNIKSKVSLYINDNEYISRGSSRVYHDYNLHKITLDLPSIYKDRIKNGYGASYYTGRGERLNFVIGNKKLALRFVILHELGHCINEDKDRAENKDNIYDKNCYNTELQADNWALKQLKKEGLL
jgi:hypothetical protein